MIAEEPIWDILVFFLSNIWDILVNTTDREKSNLGPVNAYSPFRYKLTRMEMQMDPRSSEAIIIERPKILDGSAVP